MSDSKLTLSVLEETYAVCKLDSNAQIPSWALTGSFISITRTPSELSIVCPQVNLLESAVNHCERGWKCLKVEGSLDFSLTGILTSLATPLAQAGISIFTVSTYDTDYLMVKEQNLKNATLVLSKAGHEFSR